MLGNNGHDPEAKLVDQALNEALDMDDLREPDATLSGGGGQPTGVLKTIISVPEDEDEALRVKKILYLATLISDDEAMKTVATINEFRRYGIPLDIIEYAVLAKSAVSTNKHRISRAELAAQTMMRREIAMSRNWKDDKRSKPPKDESPIA